MTVLVTGANGFLGSNLARRLRTDGHPVRGLVRSTADTSFLDGVDVEIVRGDLADLGALRRGMAGVDVVHHVAGLASDWAPVDAFVAANVTGVENVLAVARECGVRRIVHVSSAAVHGFSGYRDRCECDPTPETPFPYVETKRRGELLALAATHEDGPEVVAVRPGNVYGPRDRVTSLPLLRAMESGWMGVIDRGRYLTCPTYVENLVDALAVAATRTGVAGRAFLVTDGLEITWREWLDELAAALGIRPPRVSVPKGVARVVAGGFEGVYRAFGVRSAPPLTRYRIANGGNDYHFAIDRARDELGWEPRVGVTEACARTAAWYREVRAR